MPCATRPGEHAVERDRLAADVHDAARQPEEQADRQQHADQAELLADHGQQEVGVGLGQPVQLLDAAARPTPKTSPRPIAISECDSW
jgi:hypothetical protein